MAENEFKLDTTFTNSTRNYLRPGALVFAIAGIVLIILTMTTGLAAWLLPMDESYMLALVPTAPDGAEPLSLRTLDHQMMENTLTVSGSVANRTEFTISKLEAQIEVQDRFGFTVATISIPLEPSELPLQGIATFQNTVTANVPLSGYALKFKLTDGPFVPHKDERAATYEVNPTQD